MQRIGIVCAFLAGRNTGMFTVEWAAKRFFSERYPDAEITFYVLGDPAKSGFAATEIDIAYTPLASRRHQLWSSDLIVFWGDFLHAPGYWRADLLQGLVNQGIAANLTESEDLIYSHLMLETAPEEVLAKTVLFGGTIIPNTATEMSDARYNRALGRLLGLAGDVFFRDAYSAAKAVPYRKEKHSLGTDCAFLLDLKQQPEDLAQDEASDRPTLGVFFGRANWIAQALLFSRLLASRTGMKAEWLPWFPSPKRHAYIARTFCFPASAAKLSPFDILDRLAACQAVVTDTYHLTVNAWRLGIPAVCIGRGAERRNDTLGDKKKEVLYSMHGASPYYIFREHLMLDLGLSTGLNKAAAALADENATREVISSIRAHRTQSMLRLASACDRILAKSEPI